MNLSIPNTVRRGVGFYVSFNDVDHAIYGADTTALVLGQGERFHILNGDHRQQYAALVPDGWDACLAYFASQPGLHNHRSDPL